MMTFEHRRLRPRPVIDLVGRAAPAEEPRRAKIVCKCTLTVPSVIASSLAMCLLRIPTATNSAIFRCCTVSKSRPDVPAIGPRQSPLKRNE